MPDAGWCRHIPHVCIFTEFLPHFFRLLIARKIQVAAPNDVIWCAIQYSDGGRARVLSFPVNARWISIRVQFFLVAARNHKHPENRINYKKLFQKVQTANGVDGSEMHGHSLLCLRNLIVCLLLFFFWGRAYNEWIDMAACLRWSLSIRHSDFIVPTCFDAQCAHISRVDDKTTSKLHCKCQSASSKGTPKDWHSGACAVPFDAILSLWFFIFAVVLPTWINEVHQQRRQIKSYPSHRHIFCWKPEKKKTGREKETRAHTAHANEILEQSQFVCRLLLQNEKKKWKCKLQVALKCAVGWCVSYASFAMA